MKQFLIIEFWTKKFLNLMQGTKQPFWIQNLKLFPKYNIIKYDILIRACGHICKVYIYQTFASKCAIRTGSMPLGQTIGYYDFVLIKHSQLKPADINNMEQKINGVIVITRANN